MTCFAERIATLPSIDNVASIDLLDRDNNCVHSIPNADGKRGSLRLYNYLSILHDGILNKAAAFRGLEYFGELVDEAKHNYGKHPNIDLLLQIMNSEDLEYKIVVNQQ